MSRICIFITICFSLFVIQAKEVKGPAFIVAGEPIPQGLTLSYEQTVPSGDSSYQSLLFDATPLVINKSDRFQLFGILGLMSEFYGDSLHASSVGIPENYLGAYVAMNVSGAFGNTFFYQSYHSLAAFGAKADLNHQGAFRYFQVTTVGKKWRPNFQTSLGLLSSTRHGDPLLIPLAKITLAKPKMVLDCIIPVSASVRVMTSENFHIVPFFKSVSAGFDVIGQRDAIQRSSNSFGVNLERRIKGWFWVKGGALFSTKSKFTSIVDHYDEVIVESPAHAKIVLELFIRPDRVEEE